MPLHSFLMDTGGDWILWDQFWRVFSLRDHNTRVVLFGAMLLGMTAGMAGCFMLLRRRALIGDALSHATLPGIALAFIVLVAIGGTGKELGGLLIGATVFGLLGIGAISSISRWTPLKEDAALGIVLSVFFGFGMALLGIIQDMPTGNQAGLTSFIYGTTASMVTQDAYLLAATAGAVFLTITLLYKEFLLLSFDPQYAQSQGWPVGLLDLGMMFLMTLIIVIGLQAVGLILVIALFIIPPAAARFWTDHLRIMLVIASGIGALSGLIGAGISGLAPDLPAGAVIVLTAALFFFISMVIGTRRGMIRAGLRRAHLVKKTGRQHILRSLWEWEERHAIDTPMPTSTLQEEHAWTPRALRRHVGRCLRQGLIERMDARFHLTPSGRIQAQRIVRNHRLWELYLVAFADIAPSHVDRDADQIEHVLDASIIAQLESRLDARSPTGHIPASVHELGSGGLP